MLSWGSQGSAPRRWRTRNSAYVFGMTCINPIAPFCETARASPKLSTRITARIQLSGMLNRCAASVTKTAKGRAAGGQAGRPRGAGLTPADGWAAKTPSSNCAQTACSLLSGVQAAGRNQASIGRTSPKFRRWRNGAGSSMGPKRSGAADNRGGGQWPEVPPVKRVGRQRVHEEDFAHGDDAAALPDRQGTAATVALMRFADRDGVHADCEPFAAGRLSGKRRDMFHERHAARQVTAVGEEARERLRRLYDD